MNAKPTNDKTLVESIGIKKTHEPKDAELEAIGDGAARDGCGISVKHAQSGVFIENSVTGDFHGISYGAFRSTVALDRDQQHLVVVFEQHDGEYELRVDGRELKSLARQMTTQQRVTLHVGGQVTRIEVVKREKSGG